MRKERQKERAEAKVNVCTYCVLYVLALKYCLALCSILSLLSLLYTGNGLT